MIYEIAQNQLRVKKIINCTSNLLRKIDSQYHLKIVDDYSIDFVLRTINTELTFICVEIETEKKW